MSLQTLFRALGEFFFFFERETTNLEKKIRKITHSRSPPPLDNTKKPLPLSRTLEGIPERLVEASPAVAVAANVWPNDGQERNANAEAAFGRLAVSTVNEREPIRKADGGSPDFDASERRNNEGEKEREGYVLLEGEEGSTFSSRKEKEKCVFERGRRELSFCERVERAQGLARSTGASCARGLCALTSGLCSFLRQGSRPFRS